MHMVYTWTSARPDWKEMQEPLQFFINEIVLHNCSENLCYNYISCFFR